MSFARYFELSSFILIATGFIAIATTGAIDTYSIVLFGSALIAGWFIDTSRLRKALPPWAMNAAACAALLFYYLDYRFLSRSFMVSIIHLIFLMASLKYLTRTRDRDYVSLYMLSFAELLGAAALTVDFIFASAFLLFLIAAVSTLILFEIRRRSAAVQKSGRIRSLVSGRLENSVAFLSPFPAATVFTSSSIIVLLILTLSAPLFFLLPRVSLDLYRRPQGTGQLMTGFTERVELGMIGTIKTSDKVVMKVRLENPGATLPTDLKWRGITLDQYDGRTWTRSDPRRRVLYNRLRGQVEEKRAEYFRIETSAFSPNILEQTFYMESLSTDVIFASSRVKAVSTDLGVLLEDISGNLFSPGHAFHRYRYKAVSDLISPQPDLIVLRPDLIPDEVRTCCLQLPPQDARVAALARKVTRDVSGPFAQCLALEGHLKRNYAYSLELSGSPHGADPLATFLFDVRKGHCEYFATAMAIMLRQIGIPSRIVNGFRAGEYNSLADDWTVRQYDAHSWTQAYLPPYGWLDFDPTPPDPARSRGGLAKTISDIIDAVDLWWFEDVVSYDFWKQVRFIEMLRSSAPPLEQSIRGFLGALENYTRGGLANIPWHGGAASRTIPLLLIPVLLVAFLAFVFRRKGWGTRALHSIRRTLYGNNHAGVIASFYSEALVLLGANGFRRRPDQTSLEFAQSLAEHPAGIPFEALTRIHYRIRYGNSEGEEERPAAEHHIHALRMALLRVDISK